MKLVGKVKLYQHYHCSVHYNLCILSGMRVLALAKGKSLQDLIYMGIVGITDPPRPLVRESIEILRQSGVRVKMVTGDSQETAVAVGM